MTFSKSKLLAALSALFAAIILFCMLTASVGPMSASAASVANVFANSTMDFRLTYSKTSGSGADKVTVDKTSVEVVPGNGFIALYGIYPQYQTLSQEGSDYALSKAEIRVNLAEPFQLWGEEGYGLYFTLEAPESTAVILHLAPESIEDGTGLDFYDGLWGAGTVEEPGAMYYFQPTNARTEGLKIAGIEFTLQNMANFESGTLGVTSISDEEQPLPGTDHGQTDPEGPEEPDPGTKDPAGSEETPGDQSDAGTNDVTNALKDFAKQNKALLITVGVAALLLIIVIICTRPRRRR